MLLSGRSAGSVSFSSPRSSLPFSRSTGRPAGSASRGGAPRSAHCSSLPSRSSRCRRLPRSTTSSWQHSSWPSRTSRWGGHGARSGSREQRSRSSSERSPPACSRCRCSFSSVSSPTEASVSWPHWLSASRVSGSVPRGTPSSPPQRQRQRGARRLRERERVRRRRVVGRRPDDALRRRDARGAGGRSQSWGVRHRGGRRRDRRSRVRATEAPRARRGSADAATARGSNPRKGDVLGLLARLDVRRVPGGQPSSAPLEATPPPRAWRHGTGRWAWR